MAFGREGKRQKDQLLEHAELLLGHSVNTRTTVKVVKSDAIWDHLLTE